MKIPATTLLLACAFLGASCSRSDETVVVPVAPAATATPALAAEQLTAVTTTDPNKSEQKQTESVSVTTVEATPVSAEESVEADSHAADVAAKEIELRKQAESAGPGATPVMKPAALERADSAPVKNKPTPVPTP